VHPYETYSLLHFWLSNSSDKKSLRRVVYKVLVHKELQKAVLALQKLTDPETDQEACITVHALQIRAETIVSEEWRPNWMEGSDCDDGDQHSEAYLGNQIEGKPRPVSAVIFI
jgi:hypothetical protein